MELKVGTHLIAIRDYEHSFLKDNILKISKGKLYVVTAIIKNTPQNMIVGFKIKCNDGDYGDFEIGNVINPQYKLFNICSLNEVRVKKIKEIFS